MNTYQDSASAASQNNGVQRRDTVDAIAELKSALLSLPHRQRYSDPLLVALSEIAARLGIGFDFSGDHSADSAEQRLRRICAKSRIRLRRVRLRSDWWKADAGPMLGFLKGDPPTKPTSEKKAGDSSWTPVVLVFSQGRYAIFDLAQERQHALTATSQHKLVPTAFSFVRPLPEDANSLMKLGGFMLSLISPEMTAVISLSLTVTVLGMLIPISTWLVVDEAIPDANTAFLTQLALGLLVMALGQAALTFARNNLLLRMSTITTSSLQAAIVDRLIRLPVRFFRDYSSGDLQNRAMMISEISHSIGYSAIGGVLTGALAAFNLILCYYYSPRLAWIALVSAMVVAGYTSFISLGIRRTARLLSLKEGRLFGLQVQLISGISKLQVAGAEHRAFNLWAREQAEQLSMNNRIQRAEQWGMLVNAALMSLSTIALFYFATQALVDSSLVTMTGGVGAVAFTVGTFLAFYAAFQTVIRGATGVSATLVDVCDSWEKRKLVKPILETLPEDDSSKADPGELAGQISLSNVSFRYLENGPLVLNQVDLQTAAGQFIAIVGASGSGKSTLLRILLGFESPSVGTVRFDGQDLASLDNTTVRQQIGVVLQSGRINSGSLFENIAGAAPITLAQAWEAARAAGFAADIESMPMGMHTYVNEGASTLSGGQRQRLLIARALVRQPKILIFDEATSALDNRTQQIVSASLEALNVTRVVVAHRLSTIRDADRIFVLENGSVVQDGTFQDLCKQQGQFQRMIARQLA